MQTIHVASFLKPFLLASPDLLENPTYPAKQLPLLPHTDLDRRNPVDLEHDDFLNNPFASRFPPYASPFNLNLRQTQPLLAKISSLRNPLITVH